MKLLFGIIFFSSLKHFYWLILEKGRGREGGREREGEREREREICCSTYLCIHWLLLVCSLTWDLTHNLGIWGWHSNCLSYPARTDFSLSVVLTTLTNLSFCPSNLKCHTSHIPNTCRISAWFHRFVYHYIGTIA